MGGIHIKYLSKGKIVNREQIAEQIEISWRTVVRYKKKLIEMGYNIKTINGRNGGYYLDD